MTSTDSTPTRVVDPDTGLTSCCNAYSSIFTDDGVEYCKSCYEPVVPADTPIVFVLPEAPEQLPTSK